MSWILICVLVILAMCGYAGWKKGVIRIVLSLAIMVLTILTTVFAAPIIAKTIKEKTTWYDGLHDSIQQTLESVTVFDESLWQTDDTAKTESEDFEEYEITQEDKIEKYVDEMITVLNLPESIARQIESTINADYVEQIKEDGITTVKSAATAIIAQRMTQIAFNAIIHIVVFCTVYVLLRLLIVITGVVARLPVIYQANKLLGLVVGLVEGILFVWILFAVVTAFGGQQWAVEALEDIGNSKILSFLYDNSPILKSMFKMI